MAKPFKTPSSKLADITVNHFTIEHAWEQVSHISKPVDAICHDKCWWPTPITMVMVTHHLHPPRTAPIAHDCTQLAEQTAPYGMPIAPNVTRLDTGDWNAAVASHLNQGMHLYQGKHPQLGHSMGSPETHLGATTAILAGVVKQMP